MVYLPVEMFVLYFGYLGNIKETFPELIAFITFKLFFILPISVGMYLQSFLFPLEKSCFWIIGGFIVLEVAFGVLALRRIIMQKSVFYLRNAPLIDPKFGRTFKARNYMKSS